jgi:hypothetical protein
MQYLGKRLEFLAGFNNDNLFHRFGTCGFIRVPKDIHIDGRCNEKHKNQREYDSDP